MRILGSWAPVLLCTAPAVCQVLDGANIPVDAAAWGMPRYALQDTQTQFGDAVVGDQTSVGGSELNALWARIDGGTLRISMTGNLEANFNKFWVFIDAVPGGENPLLDDNENGQFIEIKRMAGTRFSGGFTADHALRFDVGPTFVGMKLLDLLNNTFVDVVAAQGGVALLPLSNAGGVSGVTFGWNNANTAGVGPGDGLAPAGQAASATTGWEIEIDMGIAFGQVPEAVGLCAIIGDGSGFFVSNQALPGIGGGDNVGLSEPVFDTLTVSAPLPPGGPCLERRLVSVSQLDPREIVTGDFDRDGDTDLVVASGTEVTFEIAWYENDGAEPPGFTKHPLPYTAVGMRTQALQVGDFDGDDDEDIAFIPRVLGPGTYLGLAWFENDGAAEPTFTQGTLNPGAPDPGGYFLPSRDLDACDIDGDGDLDLFGVQEAGNLYWYRNDGGTPPVYTLIPIDNALPALYRVLFGDLNGDGAPDIIAMGGAFPLQWFENSGGPAPTFTRRLLGFSYGVDASVADIDGDGDLDVFAPNEGAGPAIWHENDGLNPPNFTAHVISTVPQEFVNALALDVDGDADIDLVTLSATGGNLTYFINDGNPDPEFAEHIIASELTGGVSLAAADLSGDGLPEFVTASIGGDRIDWHTRKFVANLTRGTMHNQIAHAVAQAGTGDQILATAAHFDEDCAPIVDLSGPSVELISEGDIRGGSGATLILSDGDVLLAIGSDIVIEGRLETTPGAWPFIADGDLVVSGTVDIGPGSFLRTNQRMDIAGRASFSDLVIAPDPTGFFADYTTGDLDGDGDADLIGVDSVTYAVEPKLYMLENDLDEGGAFPIVPLAEGEERVAVGDIDRDGDLDLVTAVGSLLIWHESNGANPPAFTRHDIGAHPDGGLLTSIRIADVNRDQAPDIIAATSNAGSVQIYLSSGGPAPTFSGPVGVGLPGFAGWSFIEFAVGDLNRDGFPDLAVSSEPSRLAVALGNGAAVPTFSPLIDVGPTSVVIQSLQLADVDGDGFLDIIPGGAPTYVVEPGVSYFRNDGNPTPAFEERTVAPAAGYPIQVAVADLDRDRDPDFVAVDKGDVEVKWYESDGSRPIPAYARRTITNNSPGPRRVEAVDFDGDGDLDLITHASSGPLPGLWGELRLSINNLNQRFGLDNDGAFIQCFSALTVVNADLDTGPGFNFFDSVGFTVDKNSRLLGVGIYDSALIEVAGQIIPDRGRRMLLVGSLSMELDSGGVTDAGRLRIDLADGAEISSVEVTESAFLAGGLIVRADPGFDPPVGSVFTVLIAGQPIGAERFDIAYLPGLPDGKFFRVAYDLEGPGGGPGGTVSLVVESLGRDIGLDDPDNLTIAGLPVAAELTDMNGDGLPDAVLAIPDEANPLGAPGSVLVLLNGGTNLQGNWAGFSAGAIQAQSGLMPTDLATGDLDGDGDQDVAVSNRVDGTVSVLLNNGAGTLTAFSSTPFNINPAAVVILDVDTDGAPDIAVAGEDSSGGGRLTVRLNAGGGPGNWSGLSAAAQNFEIGGLPTFMEWADLDEDLAPDCMIGSRADGGVNLLRNLQGDEGEGWPGFGAPLRVQTGSFPQAGDIGDLDNDSCLDLFLTDRDDGTLTVILRTGGPGVFQFGSPTQLPAGESPTSVTAADLDDDGDLDIALVATSGADRVVQIIRNDLDPGNQQIAFAPAEAITTPGTPILVVAADVDGTGGPDLVAITDKPGEGRSERGSGTEGGLSVALNLPDGCNAADLAAPFGLLDLTDITTFVSAFVNTDAIADLDGNGLFDLTDVTTFVGAFLAGCP